VGGGGVLPLFRGGTNPRLYIGNKESVEAPDFSPGESRA
jgi:hypothetical protein